MFVIDFFKSPRRIRPEPGHPDQQGPVTAAQSKTTRCTPQGDAELVAKEQVLRSLLGAAQVVPHQPGANIRISNWQGSVSRVSSPGATSIRSAQVARRILRAVGSYLARLMNVHLAHVLSDCMVARTRIYGNALAFEQASTRDEQKAPPG
jgi:hypothetical protein